MGSIKNNDIIEKISKEFLQQYGRGVICQSELQMGVEAAIYNSYNNNNFDPEKFKNTLGRVFDIVSGSNNHEMDGLYLLHCLNSPKSPIV